MGIQFKLTITVNLSDGTEINDIEVADTVLAEDIGEAAWAAACEAYTDHALHITSLVIVAVVA